MFAVDDGIWSGNLNFADVLLLIAAILFVGFAFIGFSAAGDRVNPRLHNVLLGLGLASTALALLVL